MVMSTTMAPKPYSARYTKLYTPEAASTSLMAATENTLAATSRGTARARCGVPRCLAASTMA